LQSKGIQHPADVGCAKPSWAAVLANCNATTGVCRDCGRNASIAVATTPALQKLFYFSNLYNNEEGLLRFKTITATIQKSLPRAKIGANFSPLHFFTDPRDGIQYCQMYIRSRCLLTSAIQSGRPFATSLSLSLSLSLSPPCVRDRTERMRAHGRYRYVPDPFQWIRFFREGGATLPWSEDWVWMTPVGSQQMTGLMVDMMRAAMTSYPSSSSSSDHQPYAAASAAEPYARVPNRPPAVGPPLLMYVMAHFPGNTAVSWRRQFFQDIAHGVKFFDLFDMVPSFSGYTCDYVDSDGGAYSNVRRALNELGTFEDIVQGGTAQAQGAAVAILASESSNYWLRNAGTQGAAKRTLYIALRHGVELAFACVTD
jgi:hypothetical protein